MSIKVWSGYILRKYCGRLEKDLVGKWASKVAI
jgi:hypothetical protein